MQPAPLLNEPGKQHRLQKSSLGLWMIEEYDAEKELWQLCTEEFPYGHWVDSKDSRKLYKVQVVPMRSILCRLMGEWTDFEELGNYVDFLFNSCNHKKLNTKLRLRNLRHNISNLRAKLEKQYLLSFGVQVAIKADAIAMEGQQVS